MGFAQLVTKLSVVNAVDAYSQPFSMIGSNAFRFAVTVLNIVGATGITCTPQGSADGQNWDNLTASASLPLGYTSFFQAAITHAQVRLKMVVNGTGTVILAVDCYTSQQ